jgi:hypothetical protein
MAIVWHRSCLHPGVGPVVKGDEMEMAVDGLGSMKVKVV